MQKSTVQLSIFKKGIIFVFMILSFVMGSLREAEAKIDFNSGFQNDILPESFINSLMNALQNLHNAASLIVVTGDALMCHATFTEKHPINLFGHRLTTYPDIPLWICGAIIFFIGFMIVLSVGFYLVDMTFKIGFAVVALPVCIALWPFRWVSDRLKKIITIFCKSAATFAFLAITIAFALNMFFEALGHDARTKLFVAISCNNIDYVNSVFSLFSTQFILVIVSSVYGMKLIGATTKDFVEKIFPDEAFGGGAKAAPMHMMSVQAADFARKKIVAPIASYVGNATTTQLGRGISRVGGAMMRFGASRKTKTGKAVGLIPGFVGGILNEGGAAMADHRPKKKSKGK